MNLWTIAWRSVQRRAVASSLTACSLALGVALVVAVILILGVVGESFRSNSTLGYHMVVGAKGGRLQLILNSVYYLSQPIENIPYDFYLEFLDADDVQAELPAAQVAELADMRRKRLSDSERRELEKLGSQQQRERLLTGKFVNDTQLAIPIAMGDYYKNYRVVGTSPRLFDELVYDVDNNRKYEFSQGDNFKLHTDDYGYFGAVAGAAVARHEGLRLGDKIVITCGSTAAEGGEAHEHDAYRVVGILKPTGTPNDRAVFVNIEGFLMMEGHAKPLDEVAPEYRDGPLAGDEDHDGPDNHAEHDSHAEEDGHESGAGPADHVDHECDENCEHHDHEADGETHEPASPAGEPAGPGAPHVCHEGCGHHHHEPLSLAKREVTAVLVRNTGDLAAMSMSRAINKGSVAQAVLPVAEITKLLDTFVNPLRWLLLAITVMICVVSGIGILVSMYNSMSDRRHEIAVMRALGAGRGTVMTIVLLESVILAVGGGFVGWVAGHALMGVAAPWLVDRLGVSVSMFDLAPPVLHLGVSPELLLIPGLMLLAVLVGLLPAVAAYRTDVAKSLGSA